MQGGLRISNSFFMSPIPVWITLAKNREGKKNNKFSQTSVRCLIQNEVETADRFFEDENGTMCVGGNLLNIHDPARNVVSIVLKTNLNWLESFG